MELETPTQTSSCDSVEPTGGISRGRCSNRFSLVLVLTGSTQLFSPDVSIPSSCCILIVPSDDWQQEPAVETSSRPGTINLLLLLLLLRFPLLLLLRDISSRRTVMAVLWCHFLCLAPPTSLQLCGPMKRKVLAAPVLSVSLQGERKWEQHLSIINESVSQ